jgi:tripartite-type tricarboxylate transporter receptor subunit TctC
MSAMKRRDIAIAGAATLVAGPLFAQSGGAYPNHPIRLVVPFPAAGATDIFARALSTKLGEHLGAPVVVENRPGAGGAIGSDVAAKAAPDGYTLLLATSSTHSIGPLLSKLPFDAVNDFTPIVHVGNAPSVMVVPNSAPANNVKDWIAYARKNPGKLNYGSSGPGTIVHLTAEYFKAQTGLFLVHIPYRGTALAMPDLISGKIDLIFDALPSALPHIKQGRVKLLGVTTQKRTPLLPDTPAIAETVPGFESVTWFGLYGPKGLPADIVAKVNAAANQSLHDADVKGRLVQLGIEAVGGTPQDFAKMLDVERAKWKKIIVDRKITLEQ